MMISATFIRNIDILIKQQYNFAGGGKENVVQRALFCQHA